MTTYVRIVMDDPFKWEIRRPRETGDSFVASCKQLGLSLEAPDEGTLKLLVNDAMDNLFEDLKEHGDIFNFLRDHKIAHRIEKLPDVKETTGGFEMWAPTITTASALSA
jgi:hypothetical protein